MSESNARRSKSVIVGERKILTEFLRLYKTFPCLWDQRNMNYSNREERDSAYEQLLEKYKLYHDNGTTVDVKKKIEHMRCAYRREHKKVLMNKFHGYHYTPHLWYYNLLTFLNGTNDEDNETHEFKIESNNSLYEDSHQDSHDIVDSDDGETKPKRLKKLNNSSSASYAEENIQNNVEYLDPEILEEQSHVEQPQTYIVSNEAEAFGRTIGFQLKELTQMQRILAEKLISDVVFQARLGKLSIDTALTD